MGFGSSAVALACLQIDSGNKPSCSSVLALSKVEVMYLMASP